MRDIGKFASLYDSSYDEVEWVTMPANGTASILDRRMPFGWEASLGRLTLTSPVSETVADFSANRRALVRGSVATAAGGVRAKVLSQAQFLAGEDASGAMVMLEPETFPGGEVLAAILDRGALGFITDYAEDPFAAPDEIPLVTGTTENGNSDVDCETRPFVGFAVTPRQGMHLRTLAGAGNLFALVESDARRTTDGTIDVLTVRDVWRMRVAHLQTDPKPCRCRDSEYRDLSQSPWMRYAEGVVPSRCGEGYVRNQVKLPKGRKVSIPNGLLREALDSITVRMNGKSTLAELVSFGMFPGMPHLDEGQLKKLVLIVGLLGDAGYFKVTDRNEITREQIVASLRAVGVKRDDVLLVHSSLSAFGHIVGGATSVIEALREVVGEGGTVLMPSFLRNECMLNGINKRWDHRPMDRFDYSSASMKWIGTLPMEFLRLYPKEAVRGTHASHPWCGFGRLAMDMLTQQKPDDPPASDSSALAKAVEYGGKILHFGSPIGHTTFLHYLEDHYDLPGLGPGFYAVRRPDGSVGNLYIPKHLPGPREFYSKNEDARFFREAKAKGLVIAKERLGLGLLQLMDCRQLWEIGSELVKNDPHIIVGP